MNIKIVIGLIFVFIIGLPHAIKYHEPNTVKKQQATQHTASITSTTTQKQTKEATKEYNPPWWLGHLVTLLGIIIGAGMIVWQLGRQHKNELRIQKENYREQIRLGIFQEYNNVLKAASHTIIDAGGYAAGIPTSVNIYIESLNNGLNPAPVNQRPQILYSKHGAASSATIELIYLIEKYEIVSPELDIFKLAINVAHHDMRESIHPLFSFLLKILPMEIPDEHGNPLTVNIITPTPEQVKQLEALVDAYKEAQEELGMYLFDLNIEIQKLFLKNLFDNEVKIRGPIDPKYKVVTTDPDNMKKLEKYFMEETNFGKNAAEVEARVKAKINSDKDD